MNVRSTQKPSMIRQNIKKIAVSIKNTEIKTDRQIVGNTMKIK